MTSIPIPTASEILIRDFLAANPALDSELGGIEIMTDRYTNEEWAKQIAETKMKVEVDTAMKCKVPVAGSKELAQTIDHTVLKLDATTKMIDGLCSEAMTEEFKSVCVRLNYVPRCVTNLKGSGVVVACVVGFHEGTQDTHSKLREARAAVAAGAAELDVVLNHSILTIHNTPSTTHTNPRESTTDTPTSVISKPHGGNVGTEGSYKVSDFSPSDQEGEIPNYSAIYTELASIRSLCPSPVVLKLILETSQLSDAQILAASHLAAAANFDFIKTSTGFNGPGATLPHVQLMVAAAEYLSMKTQGNSGALVPPVRRMQVKASGGVRSLEDAMKMLEAGATRLGTSGGLWIMQEGRKVAGESLGIGATRLHTDESVSEY